MSLEQAITDHASALRELAAAIRATISGAHDIAAATDKVIGDAKKTDSAKVQKEGAQGSDAKKPADTQAAAASTAKAAAATASPSDEPAPDYEAVKAKVLALSKEKGRDPVVALLERHGATKAPELKPEQYAAFIADVDAIMAGTYDPETAELA